MVAADGRTDGRPELLLEQLAAANASSSSVRGELGSSRGEMDLPLPGSRGRHSELTVEK